MSDVVNTLQSVAKPSEEYVTPDRSRLLRLSYGARVLGLFSQGLIVSFEYHTPAIGLDAAQSRSEDCSQVWAFRSPRQATQQSARLLISGDID
jgi:hypothetical protein